MRSPLLIRRAIAQPAYQRTMEGCKGKSITEVLTHDRHFTQEGLVILLTD